MSFVRGGRSASGPDRDSRPSRSLIAPRPATRSTRLGTGTLACVHCDVPVSLGGRAVTIDSVLQCPFCGHRGPARDFLSLGAPTRPARVEVHVSRPLR